MENQFFSNTPQQHFDPSIPNWQSEQTQDCFYTPTWENNNRSTDHTNNLQFDSALSSMVSSPAASNSNISSDNFVIRELIGKLGNITSSDEIYNNNNNNSCYTTPLSSPPKVMKSMALNSTVAEFSADPAFAERAAKFSCFGSRSFNGRNVVELTQRSVSLIENGKLSRVSSSPSLKALGVGSQNHCSSSQLLDQMQIANSQEESTISEQAINGDDGVKPSRKRKASSKGKAKETSIPTNPPMVGEVIEDSNGKRSKPNEGEKNENGQVKAEEESKGGTNSNNGSDEKQNKSNSKPPEPPKDYIHVRARRGQATDSHSLAERVRREKISERMKLLQDLVPGCNKVTGKALMLDEIINYVQSLQRQVEFLSMKLASVNTRMDFSVESLVTKDIFQSNNSMAHPIFPLDSSATAFYGQQTQQNPAIHSSVDPLDMQLPLLNGFNEAASQYPLTFSEDDLHAIVEKGFGQTTNNRKTPIQF